MSDTSADVETGQAGNEIQFSTGPTGPEAPAKPADDKNRPDWLPENFATPADLVKSYKELQAELTRSKQGGTLEKTSEENAPEENAPEENAPEEKTEEEKAAEAALADSGIKYADLEAEFEAEGQLSEASFARLEKAGFPREVVEEFIQYRVEAGQRIWSDAMEAAGGEDRFRVMSQWAVQNWKPEEIKAYNEAVESRDKGRMLQAVKALRAEYERVNGRQPNLLTPSAAPASTADRYESMAQFLADQADPRYRSDPAFRAMVVRKLSRSKI